MKRCVRSSVDISESERPEFHKLCIKIKKMTRQRDQKIHKIKRQTIKKHSCLDKKAQNIIEASTNLNSTVYERGGQILIQDNQKISQKTQPSNDSPITVENEGIPQYWKKVIVNCYKQNLSPFDLQLLSYFQQISVKQYSKQKITISFKIKQGHSIIPGGEYLKSIIRDEQQNPIRYQGNAVSTEYNVLGFGFLGCVFADELYVDQLQPINQFFQLLFLDIVPHSLRYYLAERYLQNLQNLEKEKAGQVVA